MKKIMLLLALSLLTYAVTGSAATQEYEIKEVHHQNLVAKLYLPKTEGKVPVVIAFGGSDGGFNFARANGEMIAPNGVAVLGLAYFKDEGLPATLDQIPMEYFISAIDYLETVPEIDANKIGVVSGSRGSEAALLMASLDARIKSVAVTTPSHVAWYGMTTARSAWTYKGQDIPALSLELDESAPKLSRFTQALNNKANVEKALIAIEKIVGPILLVSAENDQIWPSYQMSKDMEAYLKNHQFKYAVTHYSYPTGHGFSQETAPAIKQSVIEHFVRTLAK